VGIPLLFEILFVGGLAYLNLQAEEETVRAFRSAQISNYSSKLIRDMFEVGSLAHREIASLISSDGYKTTANGIKKDLMRLRETVIENSDESAIVDECAAACQEADELIERIRSQIAAGGNLLQASGVDSMRVRLRSCISRMVSKELISMAEKEKENAERYHEAQAQLRKRITMLLVAGLVFNIVLAVAVAIVVSKGIVNRLNVLVENSYRLASELPLSPRLNGDDEIAKVDWSFHQMATALAEAKRREKSLVQNSLDLICSLDGTGRFTDVNPASEQVLGYKPSELLGMQLRHLVLKEDLEDLKRSISPEKASKSDLRFETRIKHKSGQIICLDWSVRWVPDELRFICVGHDISERKEVERMKQEFMAMISHDLRTPLATMSSFHEMLGEGMFGELTERGQHLLKVAERNENRMLTLINDLLDLEKSKSGMLKLDRREVELNELLDQSVKSLTSLASRQEVDLVLSPSDLIVNVDGNRVSQVIVNLLSNAIKFSPKGGVINISATEKADMAYISISDQGRGVPDELKEAIFERFQQVEIADAVDKGGSGLGLAICKAIVELHGGKIKVENNENACGSTFSLGLPLAAIAVHGQTPTTETV
jgi:PAS domain S-box-containing protein